MCSITYMYIYVYLYVCQYDMRSSYASGDDKFVTMKSSVFVFYIDLTGEL